MKRIYKTRRTVALLLTLIVTGMGIFLHPGFYETAPTSTLTESNLPAGSAMEALSQLETKGRAPKTNYSRDQFGEGWAKKDGCDMRNTILYRDLKNPTVDLQCKVTSGTLEDPYTGKTIQFMRGADTSDDVQIDHVIALSNAWQTGAQQLDAATREKLANDPLELMAVDGAANQQKGDGDAATWLPPNKSFRCQYVARQVAVKKKYALWVTPAEKEAIIRVLQSCPGQMLPSK